MLIEISRDLLDIESGVICQQVNCRNVYGKGISGQISKRYPEVAADYHASFLQFRDLKAGRMLYGTVRYIDVTQDLTVANLYTQYDYGNALRNHKKYTDMDLLVSALNYVCIYAKKKNRLIYIPYRIGCGLAGGDWTELTTLINGRIKDTDIYVCRRPGDI